MMKKKKYDLKSILIMLLGILPLMIRIQVENITESEKPIYAMNKIYTEFSYLIKTRYLFVLAAMMLVVIVVDLVNRKIDLKTLLRNKILWFFGVYFLGVTLSAIMTEYKDIALFGIYERYEGWMTIFAYGIVLMFSVLYMNRERMKSFVKVLTVSTIIIAVIGILQYIGYDPFEWMAFKYLYLPFNMIGKMELLSFNFKKHIAYSTLFNPNYVGTYMVLVIPLFAYYFTQFKERKWKYLSLGAFVLGIVAIFAAKSSAGILGLGFVMICLFIVMIRDKRSLKYRKKILIVSLVLMAIGTFVFMDSLTEFVSDILSPVRSADGFDDRPRIEALQKNGKHFTFVYRNGLELNIKLNESNTPIFYDKDWEILSTDYDKEKNIAVFVDEQYAFLSVKYFKKNVIGIAVLKQNRSINAVTGFIFVKIKYLNSHVIDQFGRKVDYDHDFDRFKPLDGYERMGTNRGYIWSRSIPLVKDKWLWGSGPDSYILEFPQEDIVNKANYLYDPYIIVDKPHNMFLGIAINTGIMALIGFLGFVITTLIAGMKRMQQIKIMPYLMIGVLAFLLTNMFNDSTVASMPLFYMLMGLMVKLQSGEIE